MNRIELYETDKDRRASYTPLPAMWQVPLNFAVHDRYPTFLRTVRDWISDGSTSPLRIHLGADLFTAVAAEFNEQVTAVLLESVESGNPSHIATAGALLSHAPARLVWDVDFVRSTLAAATRHGPESLRAIQSGLEQAALAGSAGSGFGSPFTHMGGQLSNAAQIVASVPPGSPEEAFYRSLVSRKDQLTWWADSAADDDTPPVTRTW